MYFDPNLWVFTEGVRARIVGAVLVGLLSSLLGVARLALLGWLLGLVLTGAAVDGLMPAAGLVALVIALRGLTEYWRVMIAHKTGARVQLHLRSRLYDQIVALGPAYFGLTRTGEVIVSLIDGVEHLEIYFGRYLPQLFVAALTPIVIFACVAWLDLPVAAFLLAASLFTLLAPAAFHGWDKRRSLARSTAYGEFAAEFLDSIQGLATLKAFGQSGQRVRLLAEKAHALFRSTMWVLATNSLSRGITDTGIAVGAAAALALGAWRVEQGAISLEILLVILMLGVEVFRPLRDLRSLLHDGMLAQSAAAKVLGLLAVRPVVEDGASETAGDLALAPTIAFESVDFTYPEGRGEIHRGLDFAVAAGERIGIVGASGAGKSTIVRLLLRIYDPDRGAVRIGGRDIRDLPMDLLRRQIAVVNQDTYLFHGTVEDNLRLGKPDATREVLESAARAANAHGFIEELPQGYGTVIGERGIRLSGGQRQRVAIARALLRDAPILVLDEALSSVDAENEAVIQQALDRLMQGRTTIVLAHRLSSVIESDRILVLDQGRMVEEGSHHILMARNGVYHQLMAEQVQSQATDATIDLPARGRPLLGVAEGEAAREAPREAADEILRAEGLGWLGAGRLLLGYVMPWKGRLTLTFMFGVARVVAFIGVGVTSALAVAAVKNGTAVAPWLIALAVLAPAAGILHWLESWIAHDMAFRLLAEMRVALFRKLDELAPAYLVRRRSGDLVSMATLDVETVEYFFAHTIAPAFVAVLVPAAVVATLFAFDWSLAAALLPFLAAVAASPFLLRGRIDNLASRVREALGGLNAHAVDTVQGLGEILAFQQAGSRKAAFLDLVRRHHKVRLPFFHDLTIQTSALEVMTGMGGLAVVIAGSRLVETGALDSAFLPLLTLMAMAAFLPISEIADASRQLADTLGATRRLHAVHNERAPVTDGPGSGNGGSDGSSAAIEFSGVTFRYPGMPRSALRDVDLTVPAGATVALVGPSGAGKTTMAHLLLRFWDPQEGAVRLDGHTLPEYRLDALRARVALVAQDTYLFNDSLRANILIGRPEADEAEVEAAVRRAALADFVASLPLGLETPVGERGMTLSGGQRQRVAIARAFLRDAPVLVLDEATSHLDALSERLVHSALADLMRDRTTVVIAHRLSTVRNADTIVVLDGGRIVEQGTHDALLARGGLYAQFVGHQTGTALATAG